MNDLIDRQAAIDLFPNDTLEWDTNCGYIAPHFARRMIEELPSACMAIESLKKQREDEEKDYIQGDIDRNVKVALRKLKEIYWKNCVTPEESREFVKAEDIIINTLIFGGFDIVRKEE